jgi:hypothetical protein
MDIRKMITPILKGNDRNKWGIFLSGLMNFIYESENDPRGQIQLHHVRPFQLAIPIPTIMQRGIKYPISE